MAANKNNPAPRGGRHGRGVLRPHVWLVGPDPYKHQMYMPWQMAKAQANFRNEPWDLSFDDFYAIWNGKWEYRGRGKNDLCLSREDFDGVWHKDNIILVTRSDHCRRLAEYRKAKGIKIKRTRGMDIKKRAPKKTSKRELLTAYYGKNHG
jgi:hypothetical protein